MLFRKIIFWLHLLSGITVGSVILVMAITGSLMAFEPQLVDFSERNVKKITPPAPGVRPLDLENMIAKVREANPKIPLSALTLYSNPHASALVAFGKDSFYVNPYTGEVLGGSSSLHKLMHQIEEIHRWLAVRGKGRIFTGASNAALFFMILSGLFLWWPQSWNASVRKTILFFNPKLNGKARDWNWHNVIGVWCAPLLLVTTLTGLIMSYAWANQLLYRFTGSEFPAPSQPAGMGDKPLSANEMASFSQFREQAEKQASGWESMMIRMPKESKGPVVVWIQEKGNPKFMRSSLTLDAKTGEKIKWEPFAEQSLGRKARAWVRPIHTGEAWGIVGQFFQFLGALGAIMLVWTGFSLAWRRFFHKR